MDAWKQVPHENHSFSNSTFVESQLSICFANEPLVLKLTRVMVYVVMFLVSLTGNTMTVIIIYGTSRLGKFVHLYLMNMAIADLVITVVYMPRMMVRSFYGFEWLVDGVPGIVLCRLVLFLHHISTIVSIFSVLGIAFDRFCAVKYPLKRITTTRVAIISLVLFWIFAGILRSPFLISGNVRFSNKGGPPLKLCGSEISSLFGERLAALYRSSFIIIYIVCLILTITLYVVMIKQLCLEKSPGNAEEATKARQKAGKRLIRMLSSITIAFVFCWLLYFIAIPIHGSLGLPCDLTFFRYALAHSNSAVNPCLLAFFDSGYRRGYTCILRRIFFCKPINKQHWELTSNGNRLRKERKKEGLGRENTELVI